MHITWTNDTIFFYANSDTVAHTYVCGDQASLTGSSEAITQMISALTQCSVLHASYPDLEAFIIELLPNFSQHTHVTRLELLSHDGDMFVPVESRRVWQSRLEEYVITNTTLKSIVLDIGFVVIHQLHFDNEAANFRMYNEEDRVKCRSGTHFFNALARNSTLTSLWFGDGILPIGVANDFSEYMSTNSSIKSLTIQFGADAQNDRTYKRNILQCLQTNTNLAELVLYVESTNETYQNIPHNPIMQDICDLLDKTVSLKHLTVSFENEQQPYYPATDSLDNREPNNWHFAKSVCKNSTLTSLGLSMRLGYSCEVFIKSIHGNYNLIEFSEIIANNPHAQKFLKRNRSLLWCNVHPRILDFCISLAPLNLPAYVLLEIFDWLPLMHLVNHVKKIHLIIAVQNSIRKLK